MALQLYDEELNFVWSLHDSRSSGSGPMCRRCSRLGISCWKCFAVGRCTEKSNLSVGEEQQSMEGSLDDAIHAEPEVAAGECSATSKEWLGSEKEATSSHID